MKHLMKLAMGAAIAGALVNLLLKQQRSGNRSDSVGEPQHTDGPETADGPDSAYGRGADQAGAGYTIEELIVESDADPQQTRQAPQNTFNS